MKRLVYALALAVLLPAALMGCDDDNTPAPRDARPDGTTDGGTDAQPDMPVNADVMAETGGDVLPADVGDVAGPEGGVDALTLPDAAAGEQVFVATLSGAEEGPGVATSATGTATFVLNAARTELRFQLRHNVANATMGHLHTGWPGENGPIAVGFMPFGQDVSGTLALTPTQAADLEAGHLYANVHSTMYGGGEIRGQVLRPGETIFVATLSGSQETPPVTTTASGLASLILNATKTSVHFHATTSGLVPTMDHIHKGMARVMGPVVYPLPTAATIDGNQAITPADVTDLEMGLWYINFHTETNQAGEIRGQLLPPGAKMFTATLTGAQEVPPVSTTATGNGMAIVPYARNQVTYHLTSSVTPSNAHFHRAPGGVSGPVVIPISPLGAVMSGVAPITAELASDMERGLLYMNVHTAANPGGEARGQVIGPDETFFAATLSGAEEVPPVNTTASGGIGVMVNGAGTQLRYIGSFTGLSGPATMAHFHDGMGAANGPVIYPLTINGTTLEGTQVLKAGDLAMLNVNGWYANVHTDANPNGEIRGQVLKK
jgi:hypothetical protein